MYPNLGFGLGLLVGVVERARRFDSQLRSLNKLERIDAIRVLRRDVPATVLHADARKADLPDGTPLQSAYDRMRTARLQEARSIRAQALSVNSPRPATQWPSGEMGWPLKSNPLEEIARGFDDFGTEPENRGLAGRSDPEMAVLHQEVGAMLFGRDRIVVNILQNFERRNVELDAQT